MRLLDFCGALVWADDEGKEEGEANRHKGRP